MKLVMSNWDELGLSRTVNPHFTCRLYHYKGNMLTGHFRNRVNIYNNNKVYISISLFLTKLQNALQKKKKETADKHYARSSHTT